MQGYRTLLFNWLTLGGTFGVIVLEMLNDPAIQAVLPENAALYLLAMTSAINILLRHLTTGPVGQKGNPGAVPGRPMDEDFDEWDVR